jgi:hypothetical protein
MSRNEASPKARGLAAAAMPGAGEEGGSRDIRSRPIEPKMLRPALHDKIALHIGRRRQKRIFCRAESRRGEEKGRRAAASYMVINIAFCATQRPVIAAISRPLWT